MNLQELVNLNVCDDGCGGRCQKCPNDMIKEAVAEVTRLRSYNEGLSMTVAQLEVRNAALQAALKPFAKGAKEIPSNWPGTRALLIDEKHPDNPKSHCLLLAFVDDFRNAQHAYEQVTGGGKP